MAGATGALAESRGKADASTVLPSERSKVRPQVRSALVRSLPHHPEGVAPLLGRVG